MKTIYIIAGSSSNFATTSLVPALVSLGYTLYATKHGDSMRAANSGQDETLPRYIDTDMALNMLDKWAFDCALWLAPADNPELLSRFSYRIPTLTISAMSIAAHMRSPDTSDVSKLTAYQQGKLAMFNVPGAYSIAPGFFIEEDPTPQLSSGLHGETTAELHRPLGSPFAKSTFTYEKPPMSVTIKSKLTTAIIAWIADPLATLGGPNRFNVLCTNGEYSRAHLRLLALRDYVPPPSKDLYSSFPHPIVQGVQLTITDEDVVNALRAYSAAK